MANPKSVDVSSQNGTITITKTGCANMERLEATVAQVVGGVDGAATALSGMAGPGGTVTLTYAVLANGTYHVKVTTYEGGVAAGPYDYTVTSP